MKNWTFRVPDLPIVLACAGILLMCVAAGFAIPYYHDDAFISFRITEQILVGKGPYFFEGRKVYTSTSFLYPFLNCFTALLAGKNWVEFVPVLNGILTGLSFCICLWQARRRVPDIPFWKVLPVLFIFLPWLFERHNWMYGNGGLETAVYMLALSSVLLIEKFRNFSPWLIFIRPEGWLAGLAVTAEQILRKDWPGVRRIILQLVLSLLAWLAAGWLVYDTPIPQSFFAKSLHDVSRNYHLKIGLACLTFINHLVPLGLVIVAVWLFFPFRKEVRLPVIWAGLYIFFYSVIAAWWNWYLPPLNLVYWFTGFLAFFYLISYNPGILIPDFYFRLLSGLLFVWMLWQGYSEFTISKKWSEACRIRRNTSRSISAFLSDSLSLKGRILLEPLGMIAWHGPELNILDYPGLSSPEMTGFLSGLNKKIPYMLTDSEVNSAIIRQFRPEAFVLRPEELQAFERCGEFRKNYSLRKNMPYYSPEKGMDSVSVFVRISR